METPHLVRRLGFLGATSANMLEMIGVGPFITIPILLAKMNGPQAILGWVLGALVALCDGMVWAELGAAMPGTGGPLRYLSEAYGPKRLGRLMSFPVHLANNFPRAAVDCIWRDRFCAVRSILVGQDGLVGRERRRHGDLPPDYIHDVSRYSRRRASFGGDVDRGGRYGLLDHSCRYVE